MMEVSKFFSLLIVATALSLDYYPANCRTFETASPNDVNNSTRSSRNTKGFIETNSIQRLVGKQSSNTNGGRSQNLPKSSKLKRVFLSNREITCNDGSQAGFYLRKSPGSRKWVVFFEGGWYCHDGKSCKTRWTKMRHLMTSSTWPEFREVGGILSPSAAENPYWHNANHVFVPYCSSDSWSGSRTKPESRDSFRFMGSLIVRQVMADLIPLGLGNSQGTDLLMAGSSAGGLGVMLNIDKVKTFLQIEKGLNVQIRGVSDSGWFLDREPFTAGAIAASEVVRQGWKLWNGVLPEACASEQKEPWRCYFGHHVYNTLKSPLFVFQWIFDEAQMKADSVGAPVTPQQWNYIHEMGGALKTSLDNVTAVFAPACIGHSVLTKRDWLNIKIDDVSLTDALRCWEKSLNRERKISMKDIESNNLKHNKKHHKKNSNLTPEEKEIRRKDRRRLRKLSMTAEEFKRWKQLRRDQRLHEKRQSKIQDHLNNQTARAQRSPQEVELSSKSLLPKIIENEPAAKQQRKNRRQHANLRRRMEQQPKKNEKLSGRERIRHKDHNNRKQLKQKEPTIKEPKKCASRLLDRCTWPQCNHSCPTLTNPLTGEEMKILELLTSFGLDMDSVAHTLGMPYHTLSVMENRDLIKLFTESAS